MMYNIISTPTAGLANKLRNLVSSKILSNQMGYGLLVNWLPDDVTGCEFSDLFMYDNNWVKYNNEVCDYSIVVNSNDIYHSIDDLKQYKNICISGYSRFGWDIDVQTWIKETIKHFQTLQLNPIVKNKLFEISKEDSIGIHIRRGDNTESIKNSPIESFINVIENNLDKCIFLSTDDIEVERNLKTKYSNILTHEKNDYTITGETDRLNVSGMQDALVDMIMLSRTSRIYGSYYSSFSEYSARFGNIPLFTVK